MKAERLKGCGNSFLLLDGIENPYICLADRSKIARILSQKSRAENFANDGFLFILPPANGTEDCIMEYWDINRKTGEAAKFGMCGNGLRCAAKYMHDKYGKKNLTILTGDGRKEAFIDGENMVRVNLGPPKDFRKIDENTYFVDTSIAHIAYLMESLDFSSKREIVKLRKLGRRTRYDTELMNLTGHPEGFQVNFIKITGPQEIHLVTYESGVEDITLSCGTGSAASAYVSAKTRNLKYPVTVINRGGNLLVDMEGGDLYLIGPVE